MIKEQPLTTTADRIRKLREELRELATTARGEFLCDLDTMLNKVGAVASDPALYGAGWSNEARVLQTQLSELIERLNRIEMTEDKVDIIA